MTKVARYKLGNGMRGSRYWKSVKEKLCRMCQGGVETWDYMWEKYGRRRKVSRKCVRNDIRGEWEW